MSNNNTFYCSFVSIHYIICECGDTFPTEHALKEHLEKDHSTKTERNEYKCDTCEKIFQTEKACVAHQRVHLPPRVKKEQSAEEMKERKKYYNKKNIVCEVCGKKYASNAALRYHQRVHTGERPYQCALCPKTFTMPLFLQIHTRTHTGERPYQCPHCPKAFSNKAALLRHDRVHTGVKPYMCPQCGKTFTQSNSMKLHVKTVHLKMPAPYKSKNRKLKEASRKGGCSDRGMNVEVKIESAVYQPPVVKTEMEVYEEDGTIYETTGVEEIYEEIPIYSTGEFLEHVKVEGDEILLYEEEGDDPEVLYEEVYEIEHV